MDMLSFWRGSFYLLSKILFACAEGRGRERKRTLKLYGWLIYLFGVPPWTIIFFNKNDWIVASIEVGGVLLMLFGLYNVYTDAKRPHKTNFWITRPLYARIVSLPLV